MTKNADPARAGQQPRQRRQNHPVGWFEDGAGHLSAQHRHLMAEYQNLRILGPTVAGDLGQHLQDLVQQQVQQRRAHGHEHDGCSGLELAQNHSSDSRTEYSSPTGGRVRRDAQDADAAAGVFDHRQDVHPRSGQRHGLDEVCGQQRFGLGT
ncbi:hypothetical protein [Micromonospora rhizosphaerae]|uniref:hypothetical protein n=1 Tax=Micromonospora rhizosphaerae TaxID=568872 RepID=UPI001FE0E010|nr:hypothetical protein [Micromonospora rhizosphaerae]